MDEHKDKRLKYVDMSGIFQNRAGELSIACKQSLRECERMAKLLASRRPKTPEDFERVEAMKEFVLKTSAMNEKAIALIEYTQGLLAEVAQDAKVLIDGAIIRDRLKDQSENIELITQQRDKFANEYYEAIRKNKADTQQPA